MGKRKFISLLLLSLVALLLLQHVAPEEPTAVDDDQFYNIRRTCNSTIGECNAEEEEEEMMMESEISRRLLAGQSSGKTIGYDALGTGVGQCRGKDGMPYTPCHPGANKNYRGRGCNPIYHCKTDDH